MAPTVEQRISPWVDHYNMQIKTLAERPDNPDPDGSQLYVIKDVFTTMNGSWEPSDEPGSVPQWARDDYLTAEFLEAGADHHLFAAVLGPDGELVKNYPVRYWSDGFDRLGDAGYDGYVNEVTKESSGWANSFMAGGSSFVPERGESGPWCWTPEGASDVMCGGGLPANHHLSTFVVWQAVERDDGTGEPDPGDGGGEPDPGDGGGEPDPGDGGGEPDPGDGGGEPDPGDGGATPTIERRFSPWVEELNLYIEGLGQSPVPDDAETVYLIKDVFTTLNGSWEPSDERGSVPQWARDDYLKPFGAPDYFDDAGGDHHLFAAVMGEDGELVRLKEIIYWSDGFESVNDPTYDDYVYRETKERSGWINIPIGPGSSYVPERGESGPWCWMPTGGSETICGGGLPSNHHISTFVVWQAVPRVTEVPPVTDGHTIFVPIVFGAPSAGAASAASMPASAGDAAGPAASVDEIGLVRQAVWSRLGYADADSPLAKHARAAGLGAPVTHEFEAEGFLVQGFQGGIAYFRPEQPDSVWHMPW